MSKQPITEKTWDEFRQSGLAWWINSALHVFGWALVFETSLDGVVLRCFPARTIFRGWDEKSQDEGFKRVSAYLKDNIDEIKSEADA